jgi:molybdopterin converting factor small subunit
MAVAHTITIHVTCLGQLAETVSATPITIACQPTVDAALDALALAHPAIASLRKTVAIATDAGYLTPASTLQDGMCVLIVPPISGG